MGRSRGRYGIVFCGGGAKGAYQIGVWKYLRALGIDREIGGVSGASIGAINSMLFAQGDLERAESMWRQARSGDILPWSLKDTAKKLLRCMETAATPSLFTAVRKCAALTGLSGRAAGREFGLFSQERLEEMIQRAVEPERLQARKQEVYTALTALTLPHLPGKAELAGDAALSGAVGLSVKGMARLEYRAWEGLNYQEIVDTVLASAALPVIYPAVKREGRYYVDGGVLDNTPVTPLVDAGYRDVIVVHLKYSGRREQEKSERALARRGGQGVRFLHIWPSDDSIGETLQIDEKWTVRRLELGWRDGERQLPALLALGG